MPTPAPDATNATNASKHLDVARTELEALVASLRPVEITEILAICRELIERRDAGDKSAHTATELTIAAAYGQRAELVNQLNLALGAAHDLGLVYDITAKHMRLIFPQIGRASIALRVPSGDSLQVFALDGTSGSVPQGTNLPIEGTAIGATFKEQRVILMVAPQSGEPPMLDMRLLRKSGFGAILTAPLISGGEVIGTLNTAALSEHDYTPQDEHLLTQVAATLAVNIERRRLVERLNDSLTRLQDANEALKNELDERIRASQVAAEHERTIQEQHRELLAMSTPLIPITERVVVMPLIGILSPERARQVVETALQGAVDRRAAVVLLDVTGLEQLDSDVASMLARMAKSLRLLGCRTMLSGIRPKAAQTLVRLGIDFADLATHGTLQSAIAVALAMDNKASAGVYRPSHKPSRAPRG
jgi:anti-anti-sigma regulatory factor/GAF domain-containing protein